MIDMEECIFGAAGEKTWMLTTKVPLRNDRKEIVGVVGIVIGGVHAMLAISWEHAAEATMNIVVLLVAIKISRDITARGLADALRDGQAQILEMIATSAPLGDVLDGSMRLVESQLTGIFGSVLLLDNDGLHLRHGAAPSLPEAYTKAIDGVRIGPKVGLMRRAPSTRREAVIVADVMDDPLWADYSAACRRRMAFARAGRPRSCRIKAPSWACSRCIRRRCARRPRPRRG